MPELRWILIGFAIVLLAAIYLWGRRRDTDGERREPSLQTGGTPEPHFGEPSEAHDAAYGQEEVEPGLSFAQEGDSEAMNRPVAANTGSYPRTITRGSEELDRALRAGTHDSWRSRVEPTFSDLSTTAELPAEPKHAEAATSADAAPTLSTADTPSPKRVERRKILALRLAASPHQLEGGRLLEALQAESLQHGKYDVFHRYHDDGTSIFSVASMVEPGTFDLEKMPGIQYSGVTLFAQLPGPVPGMHALNELVACARRLQQTLGGTLQDDRGVPLTVHRIERLRQEVREFERPQSQTGASHTSGPSRRP
jgi:cell division protein ZipA